MAIPEKKGRRVEVSKCDLPGSWSDRAVITVCHSLGDSQAEINFLRVLEAGSPSSGCYRGWFLERALSCAHRGHFSLCPDMTFPLCMYILASLLVRTWVLLD